MLVVHSNTDALFLSAVYVRLHVGVDQTRASEPFTCPTTGEPSSPSLWNATFTPRQEAKRTSPPSPHSGVST